MEKRALILMLAVSLGVADCQAQDATSSYINSITAFVKKPAFGVAVLAGLGIGYAIYAYVCSAIRQQEDRILHEQSYELETFAVSSKDSRNVYALINAMEQDVMHFDEEPTAVLNVNLSDFDNVETGNACEGMRSAFRVLYEQSKQHPEEKQFLDEFVMIFKQAIDQTMVVA
jgi:hypothetical protein